MREIVCRSALLFSICLLLAFPRAEAQVSETVQVSVIGSRILITGTALADSVSIVQSSTEFKVYVSNVLVKRFSPAGLTSVLANLGAGDDVFVASNVQLRCTVNGQNGNDLIVGGRLGDVLAGGNGNDILEGGVGSDSILGELGEDFLVAGSLDTYARNVIKANWFSARSLSVRLAAIRNLGVAPIEDRNRDTISGGPDRSTDIFLGDFVSTTSPDIAEGFINEVDSKSLSLPSVRDRLNIVLITADDLGMHLGCYGDTIATTPNLDAFAASGCRFTNGYVCHGSCSPSRASILTGLYPHQHGQIGNVLLPTALTGDIPYRMKTGLPNLPSLLQQRGYFTGIIGKLHIEPSTEFGFNFRALGVERSRDVQLLLKHLNDFERKREDKPFFLMINIYDPHRPMLRDINGSPLIKPTVDDVFEGFPFNTDRTPENRLNIADYFTCVNRLDELMGSVNGFFESEDLIDNTLFVFLSDNGPAFARAKTTPYEAGIHVPFMIRWPGVTRANQVVDEFVSALDLMPTLLSVARAPIPVGLPGRPLRKLLSSTGDSEWRDSLCAEFTSHDVRTYAPQRTIRKGPFKLILNLLMDESVFPGGMFRDQVIATHLPLAVGPHLQLYNLESDPHEQVSLAELPEYAELISELLAELDDWRNETNDPLLDTNALFDLTQWHIDVLNASQPQPD